MATNASSTSRVKRLRERRSRGLARMEAPRGTIVAYSTKPGDTASDGDGRYSPYTKALTDTMQIPGLSLSDVFIQTRVAVMAVTDEQQVPWEEGGLTAKFYFNPVSASQPDDGLSRRKNWMSCKKVVPTSVSCWVRKSLVIV